MIVHRASASLRVALVVLLGCACLLLTACSEDTPLKIGFVGGLTGRVADLGVAGRDAVTLAVEERNLAGGVAGRKVELLVRDDRQDATSARQAVRELIDEQVVAIIGHMTSAMSVATLPLVNEDRVVMLSPTTKAGRLTGLDDFFLRVTESLDREAATMAQHVLAVKPGARFAIAYDLSNREYSEAWVAAFRQELEAGGGQVALEESFASKPDVHLLPIAERLLSTAPDGILLVCNAIDTALIAQQVRKLGSDVSLYATTWAFTIDLLSFGGRAVTGMTSFNSFNDGSTEPRYLAFKGRFAKRFGYEPSFATVLAYDAASYLLAALEKNPERSGLKAALLEFGPFQGLQSTFVMDRFGDVERALFQTTVVEGKFKIIQ